MIKSNKRSQYFWLRIAETECQKKHDTATRLLVALLVITIVSSVLLVSGRALF
jgi:hypothetical protein